MKNGFALEQSQSVSHAGSLLAFRLSQIKNTLFLFELPAEKQNQLKEIVYRGRLLADLPSGREVKPAPAEVNAPSGSLSAVLPLLPSLYSAETLAMAVLKLVSDLVAVSPDIDQAVIGWRKNGGVEISHVSHIDRIRP